MTHYCLVRQRIRNLRTACGRSAPNDNDAICGKAPARKCCEVIDSSFGFVRPEARVPAVRAFIRQLDESSPIYTATNLVSPHGNFVVVPSAD